MKTRPAGTPKTRAEKAADVIRLTQSPTPTRRRTGPCVRWLPGWAAASTVRSIWQAHGLVPHRWRVFTLSNDPEFVKKLNDVVGLYVSPRADAVVLSVDEKAQMQALDRAQPGLPMKKGRGKTMPHDYKRNGTTTLFAALNILTVIGQHQKRHRHQAFIAFVNRIKKSVPKDKAIHAILDNVSSHKVPEVTALPFTTETSRLWKTLEFQRCSRSFRFKNRSRRCKAWLEPHKLWAFHFIATSSSWLDAVEGFFAKLTRRRLRYGVFRSVAELEDAINRFIDEHNGSEAKQFNWTADPEKIIAARNRGFQMLELIH